MTQDPPLGLNVLPLPRMAEVERACDRFAADWAAGGRPRIEDELLVAAESIRGPLLAELIRIEVEIRRGAGERPTEEEFIRRFPADSATVKGIFLSPTVTAPGRDEPVNQIGKFEVVRLLGAGGQAETYLAFDPDLKRQVVLKVYHRAWTRDQQEIVLKEGRALARVRSPFLADCYSAERQVDRVYLVIEYVAGKTLSQVMRDRPLGLADSLGLVEQVAEGLAAVHACGLLHRDVKPSNILIGDDGLPRLIDLGLVAPMASDALREVSGTFPYMSPEQARGQVERIDARSDVFGLGAVLYELLAGRPPYRGRSLEDIWELAREGCVTPVREVKRSVPKALERICMKALAADPARRFGSAAEFQRALHRERRRPIRLAGAALIAVAVLGGVLGLAMIPRPRTENPASPVPALSGELSVKIWSEVQEDRRGIDVEEHGALPVRSGELVHLRARINQPAYLYLLWLDSRGQVDPLYPWSRDFRTPAAAESPLTYLDCPPELNGGWRLKGPSGLETALLLARRTPLPEKTDMAGLIGPMPQSPLRNPKELAVRGFDPGQPVAAVDRRVHRGLAKEVEQIDEPLLNLMERLRPHFPLIRAVRFAYAGD